MVEQGLQRTGDGMEPEVTLGAVLPEEERRFRALMATHHYLGAAPKVGETLWYGAVWRGEWVALASFSAAALKEARDAWIGWTLRHKYDRLQNNTRFGYSGPGCWGCAHARCGTGRHGFSSGPTPPGPRSA